MGARHAQLGGAGVHLLGKRRFTAADILGHRHSGIVGAGNTDSLEHIVKRHLLAGFQPYLAAAHVVGMLTDRDKIVQVYLPRFQCLKGQQQRHNFGDGRNGATVVGVFLVQHCAGVLINEDSRRAGHVKVGDCGRGDAFSGRSKPAQDGQHRQYKAEQESYDTFFHGSTPPAEIALSKAMRRRLELVLHFRGFSIIIGKLFYM